MPACCPCPQTTLLLPLLRTAGRITRYKTKGVPFGDSTAVRCWCAKDQDKLHALLSGTEVTLASSAVVPATGLPE